MKCKPEISTSFQINTILEPHSTVILHCISGRICFLSSVLASLNLPAAIEDLSGQTIPKSVLDKSAAVNEKGGLNAIDVLMQDLPELLERNREILDEVISYVFFLCWRPRSI